MSQILFDRLPTFAFKGIKIKFSLNWILILLGIGMGMVTAYLIAGGRWQLAVGLILALPVFILLHRYPWLGVLIWLVVTPFFVETDNAGDRRVYWIIHRGLPLITLAIFLVSQSLGINRRKLPRLRWPEYAMAGYLIVSLLSIYFQNNDPLATVYIFYDRVFIPMCLYLLVRLCDPQEPEIQNLFRVAFFIAISQAVLGILFWSAPSLLPAKWLSGDPRATGSLRSYGVYSSVLVFASLLVLQGAMTRRPGLSRNLWIGAFIIGMIGVFLSYSRGSWLGGMVIAAGLFSMYPKFMFRLSIAAGLALIVLAGWLLADQIEFARQRLNSTETALDRLPVFYAAVHMFEERPLFGWGYENFDRFDRRYQERVGELVSPGKDHASHNVYLTLLAEQGIMGLALFLAPLVYWLLVSLTVIRKMSISGLWNRNFLIKLWLILLNFMIISNFTNLKGVYGLGMWWLTLGLITVVVTPYYVPAELRARVNRNPEAVANQARPGASPDSLEPGQPG
jgi:O-antigen ligase